ncbi:MAG TPA: L,D-transpeptidase [Xanthobacteraceae bacterium]|nr:L,D-transpeptidase [Xanthobacteraceae bacterium]
MTALRAATVVLATGLAFVMGEATAQYYPPGPPGVRMGPPIPVEQDDDIYAPPPPANYPRAPQAVYPGQQAYPGQQQPPYDTRDQRQAMPAPAPGTNFPPPADYQWLRERGINPQGSVATAPATGPYYEDQPQEPDGPVSLRPPGDMNRGNVPPPAASPGGAPNTAVAALPPDIRPEEGQPTSLPPQFKRQVVSYQTREPAGTIIIDTPNTYLYLILGNGQAMRYGIGVGREGFTWAGTERISRMSEWPDWHPPKEMIERQPYLPRFMAGGASNPLGARALYLGKTLYRIHGTNQPSTIGSFVSSGCIRLVNEDIEDLYSRVQVGTRVVVMPGANQSPAASTNGGATAIR